MLPAASTLLIPLELSTSPRERLRLNQRLMLMPLMALMEDMVLILDTPAMLLRLLPELLLLAMLPLLLLPMLLQQLLLQSSPDQLLPAILLQLLLLVMLVLPDPLSPAMPDMVMDVSTKPSINLCDNQ